MMVIHSSLFFRYETTLITITFAPKLVFNIYFIKVKIFAKYKFKKEIYFYNQKIVIMIL